MTLLFAVVVVDPGIKIDKGYSAYDEGINQDIFIKVVECSYSVSLPQ